MQLIGEPVRHAGRPSDRQPSTVVIICRWSSPLVNVKCSSTTSGSSAASNTSSSTGSVPGPYSLTAMARRAGLTKETITGKPGEVVTIECIPARDGTKRLGWVNTITYADGHKIELSRR